MLGILNGRFCADETKLSSISKATVAAGEKAYHRNVVQNKARKGNYKKGIIW